jgi:hypothetical protein
MHHPLNGAYLQHNGTLVRCENLHAASGARSVSTSVTDSLGLPWLREPVLIARRRWSAYDIRISGITASATARTMRGMLIIKSVIDFVGTMESGFRLLVAHRDGRSYGGS